MAHLELPSRSSNPLEGSGLPDNSLGADGNLYINLDTDKMYHKVAGVWYGVASANTASWQQTTDASPTINTTDYGLTVITSGINQLDTLTLISSQSDDGSGFTTSKALYVSHGPLAPSTEPAVYVESNADSLGGVFINSAGGVGLSVLTHSGSSDAAILRAKASAAHLRLEAQTSGNISLKVPATVTTHALTLPSAQGAANTFLRNDGSGALSWVTVPTPTLSSVIGAGNTYTGASSVVLTTTGVSAVGVDSTVTGTVATNFYANNSAAAGVAFKADCNTDYGIPFKGTTSKGFGIQLASTSVDVGNPSPLIELNVFSLLTPILRAYGPSFAGPFALKLPSGLTAHSWTIPATQGVASSVLSNDGSGGLSWRQTAAANGLATLDAGGKVPATQLPSSLLTLEGTWNASTNTPTLVDGTGDAGMVYLVTVAGTQDLGSGNQTFAVGDWVLYNSSGVWQQSNNSTSVMSVNGYTGVVSLTKTDLSLGSVDNTSDAAKNAASALLTNKNLDDATTRIVETSDNSVALKFDITGTASTTTTLYTSQTADRSIVLPDASGTLGLVPASGVVKSNGTSLTSSQVDLTSEVTGVLPNSNTTATNSNTASAIVSRDAFGNFFAGTIAADLTGNVSGTSANVTGIVALVNGGTGVAAGSANAAFSALSPMTTNGDIITRVSGVPARLGIGTEGQVATVQSGAVAWVSPTPSDPANMSDALATTLGYKQYLDGTTYNGGNAPTLSGSSWTTTRSVCVPYKMQDGTWRLRINARGVLSGLANNNVFTLTINGATFKNVTDWQQAIAVKVDSGTLTNNVSAYVTPNSSSIVIIYNGASVNLNDDYTLSGDVELNAKPSWAY